MAQKNGKTGYTSPNQLGDIEPMAMAGTPQLETNIAIPPDTLDQEKENCDLLIWKADKSALLIKFIGETPTHITYKRCVNGKSKGALSKVQKSKVMVFHSYKKVIR